MNKRNLWRALAAALLCAALLCPTLALAEDEGLLLDDAADAPLGLDLDDAFDGALPDLPDLDLLGDLAVNDIPASASDGPIELGGDAVSNETGDGAESTDTPAPEDVVTLVASYTGDTLTKVYDCNKYGAYTKKNDDGSTEIVYVIEALKTIKSAFKLNPAEGQKLVPDHKNVTFKLILSKQFLDKDDPRTSADVGKYYFEFTLSLTGDDAAWYTIENPVVKVPATITPREVTVSPRENLVKTYGTSDPVYPSGTKFTLRYTNGDVAVSQDVSGVVTYGVPAFSKEELSANVKYLIAESKLKERDFFPGFLGRKAGEKAGKYRVTKGTLDFGSNFKLNVAEGYFTINPRDISDSSVVVKAIKDRTYTGKAITPKPVVRYDGKLLKLNTNYKLKYSKNKNLGTAAVTIVGKGNFTGTRKLTFRIVLKPTAIAKLIPSTTRITLFWNKGKLNTGYEIGYSTDPEFFNSETLTVKGIKSYKATLAGLQPKTTYYVRIRTYKKVGSETYYSSWSMAKTTKTK